MGPLGNVPEVDEGEEKRRMGKYYKKTKKEAVDEKVEKLFESYKLIDEMAKKKEAMGISKEA